MFVSCVHAAFELTVIIPHLTLQQTFSVSERSEQQVRFLCAGGSGVWTSCRLDPILRLFDWSTGRPLQEVDFMALVTKTLGAKTVFFFLSLQINFKYIHSWTCTVCLSISSGIYSITVCQLAQFKLITVLLSQMFVISTLMELR